MVESPQSLYHLGKNRPDLCLCESGAVPLVLFDLLEEVSIVHIFHDYVKAVVLDEGFLVSNDVRCFHGREYSDFGEAVLLLFVRKVVQFDNLERVLLAISEAANSIDAGIGALT